MHKETDAFSYAAIYPCSFPLYTYAANLKEVASFTKIADRSEEYMRFGRFFPTGSVDFVRNAAFLPMCT